MKALKKGELVRHVRTGATGIVRKTGPVYVTVERDDLKKDRREAGKPAPRFITRRSNLERVGR